MSDQYGDYEFPREWGELTNSDARENAKDIAYSADEKIGSLLAKEEGWRDLTDLNTYTIDPDDAKDRDDAVAVKDGNVAVIIARPDIFVEEGGDIDTRAFDRGRTFYLEDEYGNDDTRHMFPPRLVNNVFSLSEGEKRAAHVFELDINVDEERETVEINDYDIYSAVVENDMQLSYEEVNEFLIQSDSDKFNEEAKEEIAYLDEVAETLEADRWDKSLILNRKSPGHRLIKELMIATNDTVGDHLEENDLPAIYRAHPGAVPGWKRKVEESLKILGYDKEEGWLMDSENHARELNEFMASGEVQREDAYKVRTAIVTKLMRAEYSPTPVHHFGLGKDNYPHVTSPIRRYPDLYINRVLSGNYSNTLEEVKADVAAQATDQENKQKDWEQENRDYEDVVISS